MSTRLRAGQKLRLWPERGCPRHHRKRPFGLITSDWPNHLGRSSGPANEWS